LKLSGERKRGGPPSELMTRGNMTSTNSFPHARPKNPTTKHTTKNPRPKKKKKKKNTPKKTQPKKVKKTKALGGPIDRSMS